MTWSGRRVNSEACARFPIVNGHIGLATQNHADRTNEADPDLEERMGVGGVGGW